MTGERKFATPLDMTDAPSALRERFWAKADIRGAEECWEWNAGRNSRGYGIFYIRKGYGRTATRVAVAFREPIPQGHVVCHKCDNPPCVNPAHLFLGTQVDNGLDSIAKGRGNRAHGGAHRSAQLTPAIVAELRRHDWRRQGELTRVARLLGIAANNVKAAVTGAHWASIDTPPVPWVEATHCTNGHDRAVFPTTRNGCPECKRTYRKRRAARRAAA